MRPTIVEFLRTHGAAWLAWAVPTDGVLYAVTFIVLVLLFIRRARVIGLPETRVLEFTVAGAVGAALGTRFYYILVVSGVSGLRFRDWFNPAMGTASWGAYAGAAIGILGYSLFTRLAPVPYLDVAASCTPLGTFIGRWGCFLRGDDYGVPSDAAWAVSFPRGSIPYNDQLAAGMLDATATASLSVHPLQLYLSFNALMLFFALSAVWRRWHSSPGVTLAAYFTLYGATRFFWEFLRAPGAGGPDGGLSSSQWMSLLLIAAGTLLLVWLRRGKTVGD